MSLIGAGAPSREDTAYHVALRMLTRVEDGRAVDLGIAALRDLADERSRMIAITEAVPRMRRHPLTARLIVPREARS